MTLRTLGPVARQAFCPNIIKLRSDFCHKIALSHILRLHPENTQEYANGGANQQGGIKKQVIEQGIRTDIPLGQHNDYECRHKRCLGGFQL